MTYHEPVRKDVGGGGGCVEEDGFSWSREREFIARKRIALVGRPLRCGGSARR